MSAPAERNAESLPPHDEAAEIGVLAAMLSDPAAAGVAVESVIPADFYLPRHQALFQVFFDLFQASPSLDETLVQSELAKRGLQERVGWTEMLPRLSEARYRAANVERYCRIVREHAVARELLGAARQITQLSQGPVSSGEDGVEFSLVSKAEELIYRVADQRRTAEPHGITELLGKVLAEASLHMEARRKGGELPSPALHTHFRDLDEILAGGMWPGEVVVIAARPGVGKTTLAINIARKVALEGKSGVAIFSLEMPGEQITKNLLCAEASKTAQVTSSDMRRYQFSEEVYREVSAAAQNLMKAPIYIDDSPGLTPAELRSLARRLHHRDKIKLLIVDYLQLMRAGRRTDNREQEVAELSRQVKSIARELEIPILLLSQLRRPPQGQEGQAPTLTDLRESGAIEQDADVVIMLHRALEADTRIYTREVRAIVQKNRNGPIGDLRLSFLAQHFRFENYEPEARV